MKVKFDNKWKNFDWKYINKSGYITFFEITWQFDCYIKCIWITIFNFEISIDW